MSMNRSFRWKFNNSGETLDVGKERHHRNGSASVLHYTPVTDQVSIAFFLPDLFSFPCNFIFVMLCKYNVEVLRRVYHFLCVVGELVMKSRVFMSPEKLRKSNMYTHFFTKTDQITLWVIRRISGELSTRTTLYYLSRVVISLDYYFC